MEPHEIASWVGLAVRTLVSLGVIGLALGVVRPQLARSGWLLATTAALGALGTCCSRTLSQLAASELDTLVAANAAFSAIAALDVLAGIVTGMLLIATVVMLAHEGKRAPTQP